MKPKARTRLTWLASLLCVLALAPSLGHAHHSSSRIVSIVPALTEALFAINVGSRVVGVGSFDAHPVEVSTRPRVGGLLDPDLEQIFALRPNLVVLYGSQQDQIEQLRRANIPMFVYTHGGLAETLSAIRHLGTRTGHAPDADRLVDAIEVRMDALRRRIGMQTKPRVLLVFGREPGSLRNIYASGGVGFLHDMLESAGGQNVFGDVQRESVQLTSEAILSAAPDVIIEVTYDERMTATVQDAEVAVWNRLAAIPAVRSGRVHLLLGNKFVQPGPRVAEATEAIARVLHPDAF
jgi:iron complex transport system substrate-binding protein